MTTILLPRLPEFEDVLAFFDYIRHTDLTAAEINEMLFIADDIEGNIL